MIIDEALVERVAAFVAGEAIDEHLRGSLRASFPGIRFTLCSEDDIHSGKPVFEAEGFAIYLVGGSEHCLRLTNDYALATGVVVAERHGDLD